MPLHKTITVAGYTVELHKFGTKSFFYPSFNGDAEFEVSHLGYRKLSHYLRTCRYFEALHKKLIS